MRKKMRVKKGRKGIKKAAKAKLKEMKLAEKVIQDQIKRKQQQQDKYDKKGKADAVEAILQDVAILEAEKAELVASCSSTLPSPL